MIGTVNGKDSLSLDQKQIDERLFLNPSKQKDQLEEVGFLSDEGGAFEIEAIANSYLK